MSHIISPEGYRRHLKRHEVPCEDCVAALRRYNNWYRFRIGRTMRPVQCSACGSSFPEDHRCNAPVKP